MNAKFQLALLAKQQHNKHVLPSWSERIGQDKLSHLPEGSIKSTLGTLQGTAHAHGLVLKRLHWFMEQGPGQTAMHVLFSHNQGGAAKGWTQDVCLREHPWGSLLS